MLYADNEEKQLYAESCQRNLTLAFEDGTTLENDSIAMESMELEQPLCDENELVFGRCPAACFKVRIVNTAASYKGQRLIPTLTSGPYARQLGVFRVDSDTLTSNKMYRDIVAYDALYEILNTDMSAWYKALPLPMPLKAFRDSFFAHFGVIQEETALPNDGMTVERTIDPGKMSGADVIQAVCELNACFGNIGHDGKFRYVFLKTCGDVLYPSDDVYPSNELFPSDEFDCRLYGNGYRQGTLKYEDFRCRQITQLQIRQEENDIGVIVGGEGNAYVIEDNFLVYGKGTPELTGIAEKILERAAYIPWNPATLERRGQPWLEPGDYVKAVGPRDTVLFPVLHRTMKGICALTDTYEARGTEYYSEKVNGVMSDIKQLKGKSNVLERSIEETRSTITDLEAGLTSQISQTAEKITSEVARAKEAEGSLSSRITQTAEKITAEVTRASAAEGNLSSKITQTAQEIASEAKRATAAEGNLSSRITQTADSISTKVSKNSVISEINQSAEGVKIRGNKLELEGSVNMTGGSMHIEATESIGNIIELKRPGTLVQMGNDGLRAIAGERIGKVQYSEISVRNGDLVAQLKDDGYGVASFGWESYSDRRLKNSIEPLDENEAAQFIYSLVPSRYKYNYDSEGRYRHGLIAQQVKECMGDENWALLKEDLALKEESYLGLNYLELIADLIAVLQSQDKRIQRLEEDQSKNK